MLIVLFAVSLGKLQHTISLICLQFKKTMNDSFIFKSFKVVYFIYFATYFFIVSILSCHLCIFHLKGNYSTQFVSTIGSWREDNEVVVSISLLIIFIVLYCTFYVTQNKKYRYLHQNLTYI